jgi:integrase
MSKTTSIRLRKRAPSSAEAWASAPVSRRSCFGDDLWQLDIAVAGRSSHQNRLNWNVTLAHGSRLTDPQHAHLLDAAKRFLWSMATDPPRGRKRWSPSTLYSCGVRLIVILRWMIAEGYASFATLDAPAVERLRAWLRTRQVASTERLIAPGTIMMYLRVLKDLYRQRAKLGEVPGCDPLPTESAHEAAGLTQTSNGWIPFIPDVVAVDLLSKALNWVTHHPEPILTARDTWHRAFAESKAAGIAWRQSFKRALTALTYQGLHGPKGEAINSALVMRRLVAYLADACFIVIAGFVGMRVSEVLSMEASCIEHRPLGDTDVAQAYIMARMFKTIDDPRGRIERWLAPEPVVRAVEVLERLSLPMRKASDRRELFLIKNTKSGDIVPVTSHDISLRIRQFATYVGVPHHEGKPWHFSPHQFRKTFARFIARRDRSQLLALSDHFKHASVAMTAKGYVGNDFDLKELIDRESQLETARALDRFLTSDGLAGRMGERITAENAVFRGRAGEEVRRDYIKFVLAETDLRVHACDYGWCVFQAETARCGGVTGPSVAARNPSTCLGCANFVVDKHHRSYWQDRRRRNETLLDKASTLSRAVLDKTIGECNRVLALIGEGENESQARG